MSGIKCKCGKYISTGSYPNPNGAFVISENKYDEIEQEAISRDIFLKLFSEAEKLYKCPYCKRIILSNKDKPETDWDFYKLEDD